MNVPAIITALGGRYQTQKLLNVGSSDQQLHRAQSISEQKNVLFLNSRKEELHCPPRSLKS